MISHTVLVVEEDDALRDLIRWLLGGTPDLRPVFAADSTRALCQARELRPALVVVNWEPLYRPDDLAVVRKLKDDPATRAIPVLAMVASRADGRAAVEAGCTDWIVLPFEAVDDFSAKVRKYIPRERESAA